MPKGIHQAEKTRVKSNGELKPGQLRLLEKFKAQIGPRDEFLDFNVRGEKQRKIAEIAQVLKLIGKGDSFKIPILDFEKAYGPGKQGRSYMKQALKRYGITVPRCEFSADMAHIWFVGEVKSHGL